MDIAAAQQFLREHENAVLVTWRRDGRLQMSPVTVGLDAAGRAIISSRETTYKVRNLRRDPRAALCVFVEAFTGPWVQLEGTAEVVPLPEAMEPLVDKQFFLRGDVTLSYQELMDIMDRLKGAGVEKVGLETKRPGDR